MAIGWLSVLKMVPWGDVIENAPKVADGAKKLWKTVGKTPPPTEPDTTQAQPAQSPVAQSMVTLQTQLMATEAAVADLHAQMLASTELLKTLAEQNAQLIQRVEEQRRRVLWLAAGVLVLGGVAAVQLGLAFLR
jgi:redox-sensitive bicupin YhaK (pirin superfamily)